MVDDLRLSKAKAVDWDRLIERLEIDGLTRAGVERIGPCPSCGGCDRFGINTRKGVFLCRRCEARGDQVSLVQLVRGVDFPAALDWLVGPEERLTPAERAAAEAKAKAARAQSEATARAKRAEAVTQAQRLWAETIPAEGTAVRDYLTLRGIGPALLPVMPEDLRFDPAARYVIPARDARRGAFEVLTTGPAMVAAIRDRSGQVTAVHRTWLDLSRPKGKLSISHPDSGDPLPAKKVVGSKKGGAIRLARGSRDCDVLVMAEGIETTLTALAVATIPAAHWCGVDLGNLGGRMARVEGRRWSGLPDLDDADAFVPPPWVRRLVFVLDGDSDPGATRAKLMAGLRRAMALVPGLVGQIVAPGAGVDLNDVLMGDLPEGDQ
ncbi:hypothetical protein ACEYYA_00850 [Paracoccus sp. p3-h83]|uniref:DUF7146 domain-containing protein n=1 Tax=Paracoccus sp. p3-h83 TaxID=3342805 RepID=UPI0035B701DD